MDVVKRRGSRGDVLDGGGSPPPGTPALQAVPPANAAAPATRTYEELDGGQGRSVFFRPDRYTAADLAPLRGVVMVHVGDVPHECALLDVSSSGVAFAWPADVPVRRGERVAVTLLFDAHEAFRGDAQVASVRQQEGVTVAGIAFDDFLLDVQELTQLRSVRSWELDPSRSSQERRWEFPGGERFKALAAELRLHLEDARQRVALLERQLPWHAIQDPASATRAALMSSLRREFAPEFVRLTEAMDAEVRLLPGGHQNAHAKEWSLRHVLDFIMLSPPCHHARVKPFGYPGDYEVMNQIYSHIFEGPTLFARTMGLAVASATSSRAVRARKDLVRRELQALLARGAKLGRPVRVLSIAAGPAQELVEVFEEADELPVPLEVVLFEQDKNALTHAWRRLKPTADAKFPGAVRFTFLHDSIKRLLRDPDLFGSFGKFDLVYSCGLYDYLQPRTAIVLTRHLAAATVAGGQLLVANMVDHPSRLMLEHYFEWHLLYRTRAELLDLGRRAVPHAQLRIVEEETGANPFLELVQG
jgi:extracellular factor (EF) 3-hydroxypalmitic acid methyl ester biosynthesis protein